MRTTSKEKIAGSRRLKNHAMKYTYALMSMEAA